MAPRRRRSGVLLDRATSVAAEMEGGRFGRAMRVQQIVEARDRRAGPVAHQVRVPVGKEHEITASQANLGVCVSHVQPTIPSLDEVERDDVTPGHAEAPRRRQFGATKDRAAKMDRAEHVAQWVEIVVEVEFSHFGARPACVASKRFFGRRSTPAAENGLAALSLASLPLAPGAEALIR